jgi:hypothetical protein
LHVAQHWSTSKHGGLEAEFMGTKWLESVEAAVYLMSDSQTLTGISKQGG